MALGPGFVLLPETLLGRSRGGLAADSPWNPLNRLGAVVRAGIPAYLVQGDSDAVLPLPANSGAFVEAYRRGGSAGAGRIEILTGKGHDFFEGFFRSPARLRFLTERASAGARP